MKYSLLHLHYFWVVAREGSIRRASKVLHLTPSTISIQIKKLEAAIQRDLFRRSGRNLVLSPTGKQVFVYADSMFTIGQELQNFFDGNEHDMAQHLSIAVTLIFPKLITWQLVEHCIHEKHHITFKEGRPEALIEMLALHHVDLVLCDHPLKSTSVKLYNRYLGKSDVSLYASPDLVNKYKNNFPTSLLKCPLLLPIKGTQMRRSIDRWFSKINITPNIGCEFEDFALLKLAGEKGKGVFPIPDLVAEEVIRRYEVKRLGKMPGVVEQFYAVNAERKIENPTVKSIIENAENALAT